MESDVLSNPQSPLMTKYGPHESERKFVATTMAYHEVSYTVPLPKKQTKLVLDNCSGIMRPGLNAILGPTGSGKTTLLDVLAARKDKRFLSGSVLVNGEPQPQDFRLMSGFVVQDDTVWGTLTVRENLNFSAALRLGCHYTNADRKTRVHAIINDLGLFACADTKVGTNELRGISGGERKRTCIGMELITNPDVLFLDEPTTGLDATTAVTVVELLRKQAQQLRTIIFSIHQPRYSIFKLFDHITLLSKGRLVYAGPREGVLDYFDGIGYPCEKYNNPADHLMDTIILDEQRSHAMPIVENTPLKMSNSELPGHYSNSAIYKQVVSEMDACLGSLRKRQGCASVITKGTKRKLKYPTSFLKQLAILSVRALRKIVRDPRGIIGQFVITAFMSVLIGGVYYDLDRGPGGLQNRIGVMFFLLVNMVFGNLNAMTVFLEERQIFRHETANGYYRVSAFFLSKVMCDIIPMRIIPVTALAAITYFMIGFRRSLEKFLIFFLTLIMSTLPSACVCIFVSSCTNIYDLASILASLAFVFMMLFSGFLVRIADIPKWLHWIKYFSVFKYGLANLQVNELKGLTFTGCGRNGNSTCEISGDVYLFTQGIDANMDTIWTNIGALGAIMVIMLLLSYIQLRRIKIFT